MTTTNTRESYLMQNLDGLFQWVKCSDGTMKYIVASSKDNYDKEFDALWDDDGRLKPQYVSIGNTLVAHSYDEMEKLLELFSKLDVYVHKRTTTIDSDGKKHVEDEEYIYEWFDGNDMEDRQWLT